MINKKRETISNKLRDFRVDLQDILDTVEEELILAKLNTFENKLNKVFVLQVEYQSDVIDYINASKWYSDISKIQSELKITEESMDDMMFLFEAVENFVLERNFKESNFFMAA